MLKHKLFNILSTFSRKELKEFERFTASPFFNSGRNYLPLLKVLKKFYPSFNSEKLSKRSLFAEVWGNNRYSENIINISLTRLAKMSESFLEYKAFSGKVFTAKYEYISELMKRNLFAMAEKEMSVYGNMLDSSTGITEENFKERMNYTILKAQLNLKSDKQQETAKYTHDQMDYHIRYSIVRLAHFIHDIKVNRIIFNTESRNTLFNNYISGLDLRKIYDVIKSEKNKSELDEIIMIYILWILGVSGSRVESDFFEMKDLFFRNIDLFHHHEKYNLFQGLEAVAWIMQQNINREKFEFELVEVFKKRLAYKILSPDNTYMRIILFRSILITSFTTLTGNL